MLKPRFSASSAEPLRLRRVAAGASLASALLVTCWSVGVSARQAKSPTTKTPPTKSAVPSTTAGKTASSAPVSPPSADKPKMANLKLIDFDVDEHSGIGTGHKFVYTTGDTVISGENGRYNKNLEVMDADTNLILDDPEHHITGDKSHVEQKKSRLVVTGNVVLTLKPEKAAANADPNASVDDAKKQGAIINCDEIESFYKRKFNTLRGHLIFKQHILRPGKEPLDRMGTAEHAEYDGKKEILVLFPPVHGEDSEGKKFDSEKNKVIISTKAGNETMRGAQGTLVFPVQEAEEDGADTSPLPTNPGTAKPDDTKKDAGTKDTGKPSTSK